MSSRSAPTSVFSVLPVALFMLACVFVVPVHAGGVVGTGTPGSCTEAAFDAALVGGGAITCNCGPSPVTITLTTEKLIGFATTIDGGGLITLSGNYANRIFETAVGGAGSGTLELKNITLERGYASDGGAVYVGIGATARMENVTIEDSSVDKEGGAIYVSPGGTLTLANVTLDYNRSGDSGGAVFNNQGALNLANVLFSKNDASGWGGGLNNNQGQATLTNVTFRDNSAGRFDNTAGGGGIDNYNATLTITDSRFEDNLSHYDGGGLRVNGGTVSLTNVTLSGNQAYAYGGGIFNNGDITLTNSTLIGNRADTFGVFSSGGGIHTGGGTATITNSTFSDNSTRGYGGGIYQSHSTVTITNSTFYGNSAKAGGGFIFNNTDDHPVTLRNTIVANSTLGGNCGASGNPITNDGNNIDDGTTCGWGSANGSLSSTDPLLGALQNNGGPTLTHLPGTGSLAIDHGTDAGYPATDQRGVPRPQDGDKNGSKICDIGAVEGGGTVSGAPNITKITSKTSKPGSTATISGTGFSADKKKDVVYFGATKAKISKAKTTSIKVKIPKIAKGTVQVYAVMNGQESNRVDFTIK